MSWSGSVLPCLSLVPADAAVLQIVSNKRANETYVLYQCGTPNPMDSADTEMGLDANTKVFQIPLSSVAVADSSAAGFLVSPAAAYEVVAAIYTSSSCLFDRSCKHLRTACLHLVLPASMHHCRSCFP